MGNASSDAHRASVENASTNGEQQHPSIRIQAGNLTENIGNSNHSPDTSTGTTASVAETATNQDSPSPTAQDAGTSTQDQPPSTDNAIQLTCPICLGTTFRQNQIKRLRCRHVFHQSCIDMWLRNHRNCPLCRAAYRRVRRHKHRRLVRNRRLLVDRVPA